VTVTLFRDEARALDGNDWIYQPYRSYFVAGSVTAVKGLGPNSIGAATADFAGRSCPFLLVVTILTAYTETPLSKEALHGAGQEVR
jgi:hypothetical protein